MAVRRLRTGDAEDTERALQQQHDDARAPLACPLLKGRPVRVTLVGYTAGNTIVNHGLQRVPVGWYMVSPGPIPIPTPAEVSRDKLTLVLRNQVVTQRTVDLWVY